MQDQRDEIRRALKPFVEAFEALGVRYAVVGSVAGLSHGWGQSLLMSMFWRNLVPRTSMLSWHDSILRNSMLMPP